MKWKASIRYGSVDMIKVYKKLSTQPINTLDTYTKWSTTKVEKLFSTECTCSSERW